MIKGIYRFSYEPNDYIKFSGIFTATREQIEKLHESFIDLGEIAGKHTSVYFKPGELRDYLELVTEDLNAVTIFNNYYMDTGYDLTLYLPEDEEEM